MVIYCPYLDPVTDRIFGYDSAEPIIRIFGADSAAEFQAFASVCFGSVKNLAKIFGDASAGLQNP